MNWYFSFMLGIVVLAPVATSQDESYEIEESHSRLIDHAESSDIEDLGPLEFEIKIYPLDSATGRLVVEPEVIQGGVCYGDDIEGFYISVATPILLRDGSNSKSSLRRKGGIADGKSWDMTQGVVTVRATNFKDPTSEIYDFRTVHSALRQFFTQGLAGMAGHSRQFLKAYVDDGLHVSEWRLSELDLDVKLVTSGGFDNPRVDGIWGKEHGSSISASWNPVVEVEAYTNIETGGASHLIGSDILLYGDNQQVATRFSLIAMSSADRMMILESAAPPGSLDEINGIYKIVDRTVFPPQTTVRMSNGDVEVLFEKEEVLYPVVLYTTAGLAVLTGCIFAFKKRR